MHHEDVKVFLIFPQCFILLSPVLPLSMEVYKPKKHDSTSPTPDIHISILITIGYSQLLKAHILLKSHVPMQHQIITAVNYSETI